MYSVAESTPWEIIFGPNTTKNAWNHWLFINSTADINQSDNGFLSQFEKWNPEDLFIYQPKFITEDFFWTINPVLLSW